MRPVIGVTCSVDVGTDEGGKIRAFVNAAYTDAIFAAGGLAQPIVAPPDAGPALFTELAARFESEFRPQLKHPERYAGPGNLQLNNAIILGAYRYRGNLDVYVRVFNRLNENFPALWGVLREASRQPDSFAALQQWLGQ